MNKIIYATCKDIIGSSSILVIGLDYYNCGMSNNSD